MASVTFSGGFTYCGLIILCLLIVLSVHKVNSSATCVEKFLDGKTAETKHIVTVGERVTLRCDVTARDPAKDMVYWKFDDEVMSQDDLVIDKYKSKFDVALEPKNETLSGKDIYTISWIAELDDAGKYNCTCTTGGIQYQVWIKRPCNERKHVINTTEDSTKSNSTTSLEVLDYLRTNKSYELEVYESLNFSISLDCNCTWPEVNRTFLGVWYTEDTSGRCQECNEVVVVLENSTGEQDASITPIGCYTGKGAVTYRYRNVFGSINVNITCTLAMMGKEYGFYINENQTDTPDPIFKILCKDGFDTELSATGYVCIITGSIAVVCLIVMIAMIVIQRTMCCKALQPVPDQLPTDQRQATTVVKKLDLLNLVAKIVYGIIIALGVGCFIALLVQTILDSQCKIPWSRKYACAKCKCYLQGADIGAVVFVAILIVGVTTATIVFFEKSFAPLKPKENNPEGCSQSSSRRVSHNQVHPNIEGEANPKVMNQTETETDTPRRKKHSSLRERIPNRVSPEPSGDDCEKQSEPQWDDNERVFANGGHVPVSGSSSGQLSNMTPEKHPRPRLDPIITVPEGGDPPADGNGESPRKRKKHKKHKKHKKRRHHRSSPDGENITDQSPEHCDANINPGYVDNETKPTNDASF